VHGPKYDKALPSHLVGDVERLVAGLPDLQPPATGLVLWVLPFALEMLVKFWDSVDHVSSCQQFLHRRCAIGPHATIPIVPEAGRSRGGRLSCSLDCSEAYYLRLCAISVNDEFEVSMCLGKHTTVI